MGGIVVEAGRRWGGVGEAGAGGVGEARGGGGGVHWGNKKFIYKNTQGKGFPW